MPGPDSRLPLRFGPVASRRADEAVLFEGAGPVASPSQAIVPAPFGHAAGCMCCRPRSGAANALATLFRLRAIGADFDAVLADVAPATQAALRAALADDLLASARFRLAEAPAPVD